jgi:hypothetical protein
MAEGPTVGDLRLAIQSEPSRLVQVRPRHLLVLARALRKTALERRRHRYLRRRTRYIEQTEAEAELVFAQLVDDPDFYRQFDSSTNETAADPTSTPPPRTS